MGGMIISKAATPGTLDVSAVLRVWQRALRTPMTHR